MPRKIVEKKRTKSRRQQTSERFMKIRKRIADRKNQYEKSNLWKDSVSYLKGTLNYIYVIIILFFASAIYAFLLPEQFTFFDEILLGLSKKIEGLDLFGLTWFILKNNITSAFIAMVFGVFFGVMPVINSLTNGSLLGYVYFLASSAGGFGVIRFLLPHGIFELPAVFISLGLGARWGTVSLTSYFAMHKKNKRMRSLGTASIFLLLFGAIALSNLIAAIKEANLNPIMILLLSLITLLLFLPYLTLFFLKNKVSRKLFIGSMTVFFTIVLPLLIIAAIIEGVLIALGG